MSILQKPAPTAPETAYLWLRREISSLPWDQEAFLTENAIAEASGVSRTPVRDALLRLEAAGLLRRVPHKGAYVPALSAQDIESMMEVRQVIEDWAARKVASFDRLGRELELLLQQQQDSLADPVAFIDCDISFHKHIVHAANNRALEEVYDSQRIKQQRMGVTAVQDSRGRTDHVVDEHRAIVEAIRSKDPVAAAAAVRSHLDSTRTVLKAIPAYRNSWLRTPGAPAPDMKEQSPMDIALVQLSSPDDENQTQRIERVEKILRSQAGADLIVLPELWSAGYFHFDQYPVLSETVDGQTVSMCASVAKDLGAYVHVGSIVERIDGGALRNTSVLVDPRGEVAHRYSKLHVFGYKSLEADLLTAGTSLPVADTPFGKMAGTTCYDLRFPGLWSELSLRGAEIVVVPAAWPAARREHWQLLTSARAVEHQVYVLACNATGVQEGVELGGTSRIVDPAGRLMAEAGTGEEVLRVTIDPNLVHTTRREFPVIADRLTDYSGLAR